jgi:hypothetical protein
MNLLPVEVQALILSLLPPEAALLPARATSKAFKALVDASRQDAPGPHLLESALTMADYHGNEELARWLETMAGTAPRRTYPFETAQEGATCAHMHGGTAGPFAHNRGPGMVAAFTAFYDAAFKRTGGRVHSGVARAWADGFDKNTCFWGVGRDAAPEGYEALAEPLPPGGFVYALAEGGQGGALGRGSEALLARAVSLLAECPLYVRCCHRHRFAAQHAGDFVLLEVVVPEGPDVNAVPACTWEEGWGRPRPYTEATGGLLLTHEHTVVVVAQRWVHLGEGVLLPAQPASCMGCDVPVRVLTCHFRA